MDVFDDEILKLWRSLLNNNVRFIMIGGVQQICMASIEQQTI